MRKGLYKASDLTNEEYHSDPDSLSSSGLKLILDSPEMFYKKYILKDVKKEHNDNFDVGTAIHARILEPEEYAKNIVYYSGTRRGKVWDEFKKIHDGKMILGDIQKLQIDTMYDAFIKSEIGPKLLSNGDAELSLFTDLHGIDIRVRADFIDSDRKIIFDLKSTTGNITEEKFQKMVENKFYGYDLQMALYVDAFGTVKDESYDFYWIVMSKDTGDVKFFKASEELIQQGRKKYKRAIELYNKYTAEGWEFKTSIIELMPSNLAMNIEF